MFMSCIARDARRDNVIPVEAGNLLLKLVGEHEPLATGGATGEAHRANKKAGASRG